MKKNKPAGTTEDEWIHPWLAATYFIAGGLLSFGMAILVGMGNAFSGWGDGSSSSHHTDISSIVVPFSGLFLAGFLACLIPNLVCRMILCLVFIGVPYYALWFTRGSDTAYYGFFVLFLQLISIPAWNRLVYPR